MNYRPQPKKKDTPSRKSRKGLRNSVFIYNKTIKAKIDRERRAVRNLINAE